MLAMLATLNVIEGIAAVSNSTFFVNDAKYILSDLNTWGWVLIVLGVIQGLTAHRRLDEGSGPSAGWA